MPAYSSDPAMHSVVTSSLVTGVYSNPRTVIHSSAPARVAASDQATPSAPRLTTALSVVAATKR
jgi:hypothetical protein